MAIIRNTKSKPETPVKVVAMIGQRIGAFSSFTAAIGMQVEGRDASRHVYGVDNA